MNSVHKIGRSKRHLKAPVSPEFVDRVLSITAYVLSERAKQQRRRQVVHIDEIDRPELVREVSHIALLKDEHAP